MIEFPYIEKPLWGAEIDQFVHKAPSYNDKDLFSTEHRSAR
jgi:hypothetical protein